ncbi:unnamed protein product [Blepharisma stoltei]|uniref:Phosphoglycerate mutase n=1 Tax=Blepharisma stoltei TaxID=1481888 RepID=A0AAU9JA96_9CILI|nr:unnamed protein product [Blepharisma stoltei]
MGKLWLIRHAQTFYNKAQYQWEEEGKSMDNAPLRWDPDLCDAELSEVGIQQCLSARDLVHTLDVHKVFVSPLKRALQTCEILFKDHPNLPQKIVHPILHEIINNGHDISSYRGAPFPEYSHYDWSLVPNEVLAPYILKNRYTEQLVGLSYDDAKSRLLEIMREINPHQVESCDELYDRAQRSKEIWRKELEEGNVALVSHSTFFNYFPAERLESGEYRGCKWLQNCEVYEYNLN